MVKSDKKTSRRRGIGLSCNRVKARWKAPGRATVAWLGCNATSCSCRATRSPLKETGALAASSVVRSGSTTALSGAAKLCTRRLASALARCRRVSCPSRYCMLKLLSTRITVACGGVKAAACTALPVMCGRASTIAIKRMAATRRARSSHWLRRNLRAVRLSARRRKRTAGKRCTRARRR